MATHHQEKRQKVSDEIDGHGNNDEHVMNYQEAYLNAVKEIEELKKENEELKKKITQSENEGSNEETDEDLTDDDGENLGSTVDCWTRKFNELREFRLVNGTFNVPMQSNPQLKKWVEFQRFKYMNLKNNKKRTKLKQDQVYKLESIGLSWGSKYPTPVSWEDRFEELKKYRATLRRDPPVDVNNPSSFGIWVSAQRNEYRRFKKGRDSFLSLEQIGKLKDIGFSFKGPRLA